MKFYHFPTKELREETGITIKGNGITVCYDYNPEAFKLSFSIAQCHGNDTYAKKLGRDAAIDHFLNGNKLTIHMSEKAYRTKRKVFFSNLAYNMITEAH